MAEPFLGSEALAYGSLNRHQLRTRNRLVFPNVYLSKQSRLSLDRRIAAAWLWARCEATIAGLAAAALHGAKWIDDDVTIELIYSNNRPPSGMLTRPDVVLDGEVTSVDGLAVATPERTAFDIGRREPHRVAVSRLDAPARATGLKLDGVMSVAERHAGARGLRNLETAVELVDAGAQSPQETYLRLLLIEGGLPRPRTQIPGAGRPGDVLPRHGLGRQHGRRRVRRRTP
jgi:hypothetical protein